MVLDDRSFNFSFCLSCLLTVDQVHLFYSVTDSRLVRWSAYAQVDLVDLERTSLTSIFCRLLPESPFSDQGNLVVVLSCENVVDLSEMSFETANSFPFCPPCVSVWVASDKRW